MSLPLFLFRFCIWRSSKNKSDVCHVLCEVLIMLDVTHSQVDVETEFGVVLLDSVSLSAIASIKLYLACFRFLETAKDGLLLLSDILLCIVGYTVRKVIFLKQ